MWNPDYFVRYIKLPRDIDSIVTPNTDGSFDFYLNSLLTDEERRRWLEHGYFINTQL